MQKSAKTCLRTMLFYKQGILHPVKGKTCPQFRNRRSVLKNKINLFRIPKSIAYFLRIYLCVSYSYSLVHTDQS